MKKCILINLLIMAFSFVSLVSADDDYTKVVLSKGLKGDTAEDVFTQNTKDKTYLVVFTNYVNYIDKSSVYATYIKMKKKGKIVVSAPRLVSTLVNKNYQPTVAYNASSNSYLVAWSCKLKSGDIQVLSRKLNAKGKPLGSIIKVASAGNTINSSPQLTYAYQADPSVKSAKKFVLLYDKALPAGANGLHGVFSVYLDDKGKRVGPEYHGFSSPLDPNDNDSVSMEISNISQQGNGNMFFSVNKKYTNFQYGSNDRKPDTFVFMIKDIKKFSSPLKVFSNLRFTGKGMCVVSKYFLLSWAVEDGPFYIEHLSQCFKPGPRKMGPVNKMAAKGTSYNSCMVEMPWGAMVIDSVSGWNLKFTRLKPAGKIKETLGKFYFPESIADDFSAFNIDGKNKIMFVLDQFREGFGNGRELVGFCMDVPN